MRRQKLFVGDRITFKAITRAGAPTLTRVVNGFHCTGEPTVRAHGYSDFVVHWKEISVVHSSSEAKINDAKRLDRKGTNR